MTRNTDFSLFTLAIAAMVAVVYFTFYAGETESSVQSRRVGVSEDERPLRIKQSSPMYRGNAARTGYYPGGLGIKKGNIRKKKILFLVIVNKDKKGFFCALNATNGKELWKKEVNSLYNNAAVIVDGIAYVPSNNQFFVFDAVKGKKKWDWKIEPTAGLKIITSPVVAKGTVYFGSYDHFVYALDAKTKNVKWKSKINGIVNSTPAVADNVVYVGTVKGKFYAMNAKTGKITWDIELGDAIISWPLLVKDMVFVGCHNGNMYALDTKTGKIKWQVKTNGHVFSGPALENEVLFFGTWSYSIYAVDKNKGNKKWVARTENIPISVLVGNGTVYAFDFNCIYAFNCSNGDEIWKQKNDIIGNANETVPALAEGILYIGKNNINEEKFVLCALNAKNGKELWKKTISGKIDRAITVAD